MVTQNTKGEERTIQYDFDSIELAMLNLGHGVLEQFKQFPNLETKVQRISSDFVNVPWKNKIYTKNYNHHTRFTIHSDQIQLEFNAKSETEVELWWMQTATKGIGTGTTMLTAVLDIADVLGIKISLCPVPLDGSSITALRSWYLDFGFKPSQFSPFMTYTPSK